VTFAFGEHELDVDRRELRRDGVQVALEPQTFDVLAYLVDHRDRVVAKEELMDRVWGGRFVSDTAVTSRIKQARRALGDDGRSQGFIRTYHGRGYRFVAETSDDASPRPSPHAAARSSSPAVDLPVLHDGDLDYHLAGQGPPDILLLSEDRDVLAAWDDAARGAYLRGLATLGRLIRPARVDADLVRLLDAAAAHHVVVLGEGGGAAAAVAAAARHPERVTALILYAAEVDRTDDLTAIGQPALVVHRTGDPVVPVEHGRRTAARLPEGELTELAGDAHAPEADPDQVLEAIAGFVEDAAAAEAPDQVLTALVGIHGEDTTSLLDVLVGLGGRVRRGPERSTVVSFEGPATAVRALGSRRARGFLPGVGVAVAIDEVSRDSELVSGHGVDVARLLAQRAEPGQVLMPNVIKDLLAGSGLHVESVGTFDLPHVGPHPAYRWVR
jgi:DNA-binding winged helix-turn-helix (wHTH) protein